MNNQRLMPKVNVMNSTYPNGVERVRGISFDSSKNLYRLKLQMKGKECRGHNKSFWECLKQLNGIRRQYGLPIIEIGKDKFPDWHNHTRQGISGKIIKMNIQYGNQLHILFIDRHGTKAKKIFWNEKAIKCFLPALNKLIDTPVVYADLFDVKRLNYLVCILRNLVLTYEIVEYKGRYSVGRFMADLGEVKNQELIAADKIESGMDVFDMAI